MTDAGPVTVAQVRARAAKRVDRDLKLWASDGGDDARLVVALHPPTEREVLNGIAGVRSWVAEWRETEQRLPVKVEWAERRWANVGTQRVPIRVTVLGADAMAVVGGAATRSAWQVARDRAQAVRDRLDVNTEATADVGRLGAVLRKHIRDLAALSEEDFGTLLRVVEWLADNPASGLRVRQVPIRGIHTKWLESHLILVTALHNAVTGRESIGLLVKEELIRIRFLDGDLAPGAPRDLAATAAELAALDVAPRTVLVLENLESVLSLPDLPGVVAVHGSGNAVASRLRPIPWVMATPVVYWGDLDSYGFRILGQFRAVHAGVHSALMDSGTLWAHRDLCGPEKNPVRGDIAGLTPAESTALQHLREEGDIRLEQERIPWEHALTALVDAIGEHGGVP